MNEKEKWIKISVITILFFSFISSVFLIFAERNGLWLKWFSEEKKPQALNIVTDKTWWKYMDIGEEPGVGNVWTTTKYDAHTWGKRQEIFEKSLSEDNLSSTAFFRYEFDVQDIDKYFHMEGHIRYKDAVIIYLNGSIIYTGNVPSGGYYSNQDMGASNTVDTMEESIFYVTDLSHLKKGKNILAVEIHRKDIDSNSIYFDFPYLKLFETKQEENIPDTKGMMLIQGRKIDEIEINWLTDSNKSYKVEYMEGTKENVNDNTFSNYANTIIMGSKKSESNGIYTNTATLTRLKEGTDYIYRVIENGKKKGSRIYGFRTAEKKEIRFAFPGLIQEDYTRNNSTIGNWQNMLQQAIELGGGTDILILRAENQEIGFRSAMELKKTPSIVLENHQIKNHYWAYLDMIFIKIDAINGDYNENKDFMKKAIKERNRKWVIVIMDGSISREDMEIKKQYEELFKELDVDLVMNLGNLYSRYYTLDEGKETRDTIDKVKGETVYITSGIFIDKPCIIKVKSTRFNITIETYRIEDGEKVDFCRITKGN